MLVDYHMHLMPDEQPLSDGLRVERVAEIARAARARGIDDVCVTEHVYRFAAAAPISDHAYWQAEARHDIDAYRDVLAEAREQGHDVRTGIELDWLGFGTAQLDAVARSVQPDLVLGSVHWLGEHAVDHPEWSIWEAYPVDTVYARYFGAVRDAAASGLYDVLAHIDLAKVFGHRPSAGPPLREYEETADAAAAADVAVEISTAGLRKQAQELYPAPELLRALQRRGVPITLASDAHVPADVGRDLDRAVGLAHDAGYRTVSVFRRRERRQEPLG